MQTSGLGKITLTSSSGDGLRFALVAHDARKDELVTWVGRHQARLSDVRIVSTGTTGGRIIETFPKLDVTRLKSGPLGGDQQIGALIVNGLFGQKADTLT